MVTGLISDYRISLRRACEVSLLSTSVWYYKHHRPDDSPLRLRIKSIAETRVRYGIERIVVLLKLEGWRDNPKRIYRIYKEEGLNLRVKRPRRCRAAAHRSERPVFSNLHDCWSMDFVADALFDGRKIRCLTIVDNYSRKCMAIAVGQGLKGSDVVSVLEGLRLFQQAIPRKIQVDNGSELQSNHEHQIK
ncbi:MAG: hypothetical protein K0S31_3211 [Sphingobacterium multivorum]|jgi:putative transposase|nr:hypothetical protein [Sphingobacterium multivorum]